VVVFCVDLPEIDTLMRIVCFLLFATLLLSCNQRKNAVVQVAAPQGPFYHVYQLSPKTTAFVVNFSENDKKGQLDSIFGRIIQMDSGSMTSCMPDCSVYDSSGAYALVYSDKLATEIGKHFGKEYYVYGTQGSAKAAVRTIVFGLDECRTNIFTFCLDSASLTAIGHPVFCSDREIDLQHSNDYERAATAIGAYLAKEPADYDDSIKLKVLGNTGNYYFTYNDDFLWWRKGKEAKCKFPARCIYKVDDSNKVSRYWGDGLDLFGVGCD